MELNHKHDDKLAKYLKFTEDPQEMIALGHRIVSEYDDVYKPQLMANMRETVRHYMPDADEQAREDMLFRSIYDYWAYGNIVDEEFYLKFYEKTHEEKLEYMVNRPRLIYVNHQNSGGGLDRINMLEDKYRLYQHLKPYYLRDVIVIRDDADYPEFESFVKKHEEFVVKPSDYSYGIGVHKASLKDFGGDIRAMFDSILAEGHEIKRIHTSRDPRMVLEELIDQDPSLAVLHPDSVNGIRATAVRGKDNKIHIYHPWIKVGVNGTFVASAALDGFDAEIDPETGVVITDGYQENGNVYKVHPDSGITIKGFQIPKWDELVELVDQLMAELPEYGYIGWDLVLTPRGWCVMEGNYSGEFTFQLINGRGFKKEFEELIGWKYDKDFWWRVKVV